MHSAALAMPTLRVLAANEMPRTWAIQLRKLTFHGFEKKSRLVFQKQKQTRETRLWKIRLMLHSMTEKQRRVGDADALTK